jgi:hypothetical protein
VLGGPWVGEEGGGVAKRRHHESILGVTSCYAKRELHPRAECPVTAAPKAMQRPSRRHQRGCAAGRELTAAAALRRIASATRECPCTSTVLPLRMKRSPSSAMVARARFDVSAAYDVKAFCDGGEPLA